MPDAHASLSSSPEPSLTSGGEPALAVTPRARAPLSAAAATKIWPEWRNELLRKLHADGLSASKIGDELGCTRNAVIGRLHREGIRGPREIKVRRTAGPKPRNAHGGKRVAWRPKETHKLAPAMMPDRPAEPTPATACTILDLTNETCRFPIGELMAPAALFCGAPGGDLAAGNPYCGFHSRLAYAPARGRL